MLPDFNRLHVFFHIYRAGGVRAAADILHVTQSAVSQHLGKLERELDAQLFVRQRGKLIPTQAAHNLYRVVAPFVAELERSLDDIHQRQTEIAGTLRIGAPVVLGGHRLPAVLAAFRRQHPRVRFTLHLGHPATLLPMLEAGQLDLALADIFASRRQQPVGFAVQRLMDEELVLVGSKKRLRQFGDEPSLETLLSGTYIAYSESAPALQSWFHHHFRKTAVKLDLVLTVESVQAVVGAVEQHIGFGVVPSHLVERQLARGLLRTVATRQPALTNRVSLVQLLDRVPTPAERAFAKFVRANL